MASNIIYVSPPVINSPNNSDTITQSFALYGYYIVIIVLLLIALTIKIAISRKRFQARNAALRQTIARQNQLSTVSGSVDANRTHLNEGANNIRRDSDSTIKIDVPPTYEEVMKNFVDVRGRAATAPTSIGQREAVETINTQVGVGIVTVTNPTSEQRTVV